MTAFAQAASSYALIGWQVFPLQPRTKIPPAGFHWRDLASTDPADVERRWRRAHDSNIGVATGPVSGFWVLDLDGPEALEALRVLEQRHGALPATVTQLTGKGEHRLFAWAEGIRNRAKIGKVGIDIRGDGGYIVVAPSIHPSGRAYAWAPGLGPGDVPLAEAPAWLLELARPSAPEPSPAPAAVRHRAREGRASAYGEAALSRACREIAAAPQGRRDDSVYDGACSIGRLVAGEEIEADYAREALISAGSVHVPSAFTMAALQDKVDRAFKWAEAYPLSGSPRDPHAPRRATPRPAPAASSPVEEARAVNEAAAIWAAARSPWVRVVGDWFRGRGLEPGDPPGALDMMRVHPGLRFGPPERFAPCLVARMIAPGGDLDGPVEALAVLPLDGQAERFSLFYGDPGGRVIPLAPLTVEGALLVTLDLQDAWALTAEARRNRAPMRTVVAPRLRTFAGGALGDKWGRVDPLTPAADPADPPWRRSGEGQVYLAVRRDLNSPPLKARAFAGGTRELRLQGDDAAAYFGGLALQHWARPGPDYTPPNAVRLLQPHGTTGFHCKGDQ